MAGRSSSVTAVMVWPLILTMRSSGSRPARLAGLSGSADATITPLGASKKMFLLKSRNGCNCRPVQLHLTLPEARICSTTRCTVSEGIEKATSPPLVTPRVLMPMICPLMLTSGPPELPGEIDASVCNHRLYSL